jgi:hypothetical protein
MRPFLFQVALFLAVSNPRSEPRLSPQQETELQVWIRMRPGGPNSACHADEWADLANGQASAPSCDNRLQRKL